MRDTDRDLERLSGIPLLLVALSLALLGVGIGAALHWAATTEPQRTVLVNGMNGPGMVVDRIGMRCRVWGTHEVCVSRDVRWGDVR